MAHSVLLCIYAALLLPAPSVLAQDTTIMRSEAESTRDADSIRAAYSDTISHANAAPPPSRAAGASRSLEIRGHRLGDSRWLKKNCFKPSRGEGPLMCNDPDDKIGNMWARVGYVFTDDVLTSVVIYFDSYNYGSMRRAFEAKLGPPDSVTQSELQNELGAHFVNEKVKWLGQRRELFELERYGTSLRGARGVYISEEAIRAMEQAKDSAAQRARRDL
jgi:hypothetical protein